MASALISEDFVHGIKSDGLKLVNNEFQITNYDQPNLT